MRQKTKQ